MKKFTFRMETLLKVRIMEEEKARIHLGQANQLYLEEKEQEYVLTLLQNKTLVDFRNKQNDGLTIETLKTYHYFVDKIKGDLFLQLKRVQEAEERRASCLKRLEEVVKNRKLVEKLKEKQLKEYQEQSLREEQNLLDELGLQSYIKDI